MIMRKWWQPKASIVDSYHDAMYEWVEALTERTELQRQEIDRAHCRIDMLLDRLEESGVLSG
jgi:hypothetical protein